MQLLVNAFVLLLCRRVPNELVGKKFDGVFEKVKLLSIPREPEPEQEEVEAVEEPQKQQDPPQQDNQPKPEAAAAPEGEAVPAETIQKEDEAAKQADGKKEKSLGAVIRFTVPRRKRPEPEEGEEPEPGPMFVEVDQEGKGLAVDGRAEALPHYIEVINTYAGRMVREDFV